MRAMSVDADVALPRVRRARLRKLEIEEPEPWDNGAGQGPGGISLPTDWTAKRAARLMTQARNATSRQEWEAALDACDRFDHDLWIKALSLAGRDGSWSLHRNNIEGKVYDGPYLRGYNPDAPMFERYRRKYLDARDFTTEQVYVFVMENPAWHWYPHVTGSFMCNAESGRLDKQEDTDNGF